MGYYSQNKPEGNEPEGMDFLSDYDEIPMDQKVPDGVWKARVRGWKPRKSRNEKPFLRFSFEICSEEYAGMVVVRDCFFTDAAKQHSKKFCESLGIDPRKKVEDYPPIYVKVKTQSRESRDGKVFVEVVDVRKLKKQPVEVVDDAEGDMPGAL